MGFVFQVFKRGLMTVVGVRNKGTGSNSGRKRNPKLSHLKVKSSPAYFVFTTSSQV